MNWILSKVLGPKVLLTVIVMLTLSLLAATLSNRSLRGKNAQLVLDIATESLRIVKLEQQKRELDDAKERAMLKKRTETKRTRIAKRKRVIKNVKVKAYVDTRIPPKFLKFMRDNYGEDRNDRDPEQVREQIVSVSVEATIQKDRGLRGLYRRITKRFRKVQRPPAHSPRALQREVMPIERYTYAKL